MFDILTRTHQKLGDLRNHRSREREPAREAQRHVVLVVNSTPGIASDQALNALRCAVAVAPCEGGRTRALPSVVRLDALVENFSACVATSSIRIPTCWLSQHCPCVRAYSPTRYRFVPFVLL